MGRRVNVVGVGMVPFQKPGKSEEYNVMAAKASRTALEDAGIDFGTVEQAYAGYVFGDSTCGQRAVYEVGLTGIPVFNVNNNCSTGSSALMLGSQAIAGGMAECVLVVGFEQMEKGALGAKWTDRTNPLDKHANLMSELQGFTQAPPAAQMFGGAGREYQWQHGTKRETFAKISEKARKHAAKNPYALFRDELSVDEILASPEVFDRTDALPVLSSNVRRRSRHFSPPTSSPRSTTSAIRSISPVRRWRPTSGRASTRSQ